MSEKRGYWFLPVGVALGVGIGILIAWGISPIQYVDTTPSSLRTDYKDEYRFMIASAYIATGDLPRAQARLTTLADPDPVKAIGQQAQRMLSNNSSMDLVQILADLSEAIQNQATLPIATAQTAPFINNPTPFDSAVTPAPSSTDLTTVTPDPATLPTQESTPSPIPSPLATIAPHPVHSATPTPEIAFEITKQNTFCDPDQPGLLQILLTNSAGKPAAGIELVMTWFGGEEHFFTGLKPEISYGYADYTLGDKIEYALTLASSGTRVTGLLAPTCTDPAGKNFPGGIHLEFKQP